MTEETTTAATFIGPNKIASVVDVEQKTPMGSPIVEVTFENGKKQLFTKRTYEVVVTDVASDDSIVRRSKFNQMVPAIKSLICEFDIPVAEIQPLLQEIAASIDNNFARATNFAWTKNDLNWIPNTNPLYERTLLEADALIRSIRSVEEQPKVAEGAQNDGQ